MTVWCLVIKSNKYKHDLKIVLNSNSYDQFNLPGNFICIIAVTTQTGADISIGSYESRTEFVRKHLLAQNGNCSEAQSSSDHCYFRPANTSISDLNHKYLKLTSITPEFQDRLERIRVKWHAE